MQDTPEATPEPTPNPTPNPMEAYSGNWTWECGDGSLIWELYADGKCLVPEQSYGIWSLSDETLTMTLAEDFSLQILEEDGFVKLYCPLINQTLVRCEEREAAYAAKFVDVALTSENFWEYFRLERVPAPVDENGKRIFKETYIFRNTQYENGLIFWSERDIGIDLVYWWSYRLHIDKAPYGAVVYEDYYNSTAAEGTLTFIRSDHVTEHSYDGAVRRIVTNSGETLTETFEGFRYDGYPY